jgi:diacylglycerol kinase family enzyme
VAVIADVARAVIKPYTPVPYQVDGDYLGESEHLTLAWEPDHLRLIVPGTAGSR